MRTAIVIGGGPAGSLSALLLARAGFAVQLLEQHRFPRDKVCGECLSALGLDVLARAGMLGPLRSLGPVELARTLIHPVDGPTLDIPLPRTMWGLTRRQLDVALLDASRAAGVVVRQPARCESVDPGPTAEWRDLLSNQVIRQGADWVVLADGKAALTPPTPPRTGDFGIKAHFAHVTGPSDAIELFAGPGCYGGLAPVEGGQWNAAFSLPASMLKEARGDVDAAFRSIVGFNPVLARRLHGATLTTPWLSAPLPRFAPIVGWARGVVPVGNAAAALEPIGGEGMGLALRSAELAVEAITAGDPERAVSQLHRRYQRLWVARRLACRGIARIASHPSIGNAIAPLLFHNPSATRAIMGWAGKVRLGAAHRDNC